MDDLSWSSSCPVILNPLSFIQFSHAKDCAVKMMSDNISAVSYINNLGETHSSQMSHLASDIWNTLVQYNITSLAYHLPGCEKYNADWLSRSFSNYNNDFSLSHQAYACIIEQLPFPWKSIRLHQNTPLKFHNV